MEELILHNPHNHLIHQRYAEIRYTQVRLYVRASRVLEWVDKRNVCCPQICINMTEFDINKRVNWKEKKILCVRQVILLVERQLTQVLRSKVFTSKFHPVIFWGNMQCRKWGPVSLGYVFIIDCLIIWIW
jgi:hypothetical protein